MTLRIEESFEVEAPLALAWSHLGDPHELARCVPGAELGEPAGHAGGPAHEARMIVRVGSVRLAYAGTLRVEERDDAAHRLRVRAEGGGADGHAGLVVTIALEPALERRTMVHVRATLDVTGRVVHFGPGMIEGVARQVLHEFAACMRAALEGEGEHASGIDETTTVGESMTLSGAYREHPMLKDTLVGIRSPVASLTPQRNATAMESKRETMRVALLPRLWNAALDRLRNLGRRAAR